MRRRLIVLAVLPLLTVGLGAGAAQAAPVHQARPSITTDQIRDMCWGVDTTVQPQWQGSNPQREYNTQVNAPCATGGLVTFVIGPCYQPPYQGYCAFEEVSYDAILGIWTYTGTCLGYSDSLDAVVRQTCGNYLYQAWAGTGGSPDLIWSLWLEWYYPHQCPIAGGYTQRVITADSNSGPLYLSCPQGAGGQSYLAKQSWYLDVPIL